MVTGDVIRNFCTSCQRMSLVSAGRAHRMANGKVRFVCAACVQKMQKMKGATA